MSQESLDPQSDAEYNCLRHELLDICNRELTLVNLSVTATAAILAFAFTSKIAFIFLLPLIILYTALNQICDSLRGILNIVTYIRVCIEPGRSDLKWESFIYELRTTLKKQGRRRFSMQFTGVKRSLGVPELNYASALVALGVICSVLSIRGASQSYDCLTAIIVLLLWLLFSVKILVQLRYLSLGMYEEDLEGKYKQIWQDF